MGQTGRNTVSTGHAPQLHEMQKLGVRRKKRREERRKRGYPGPGKNTSLPTPRVQDCKAGGGCGGAGDLCSAGVGGCGSATGTARMVQWPPPSPCSLEALCSARQRRQSAPPAPRRSDACGHTASRVNTNRPHISPSPALPPIFSFTVGDLTIQPREGKTGRGVLHALRCSRVEGLPAPKRDS